MIRRKSIALITRGDLCWSSGLLFFDIGFFNLIGLIGGQKLKWSRVEGWNPYGDGRIKHMVLSTAIEVGGKAAITTQLAEFNQSKRSALLLGSRIRWAAVL